MMLAGIDTNILLYAADGAGDPVKHQMVFSEDLQDGRELEGVRFLNPFAPANASTLEEVLTS